MPHPSTNGRCYCLEHVQFRGYPEGDSWWRPRVPRDDASRLAERIVIALHPKLFERLA